MLVEMQIPAIEIQPGDVTVDLGIEMNFTVRAVGQRMAFTCPADVAALGGWVVLVGDTEDGYYRRYYEAEQEYHAAPDELVTVIRSVPDAA